MTPTLHELERLGCVGPTDVALARALRRLSGQSGAEAEDEAGDVEVAVALTSRLVEMGHVCLALDAPPALAELRADGGVDDRLADELATHAWPAPEAWRAALRGSPAVAPGEANEARPLVLDAAGRLYLRRYFEHEQRLAAGLLARASAEVDVDEAALGDGLARVFGASSEAAERASAGQRRAVEAAMRRRLCVVSGGPGTGKTSTVARILVLAVEQARAMGRADPRILLIAPTGKAAAALTGALARNLESVDCDDAVRAAIPRTAATIHRALQPKGGVGAGFQHDAAHPLPADFVVVDEASMVDLALMRRLVEAVPGSATLVLMGDADQLASVEAGAVLADVCGDATGEGHEPEGRLRPSIVRLTHSYRFAADSGIGELSRAIRAGDAEAALAVLADEGRADASWIESEEGVWPDAILEMIDEGYAPLASARDAESALASLDAFRVLSPHRVGRLGVERLNRRIASRVAGEAGARGRLFEPVLVERNDPAVSLWNGDMGVRRRDALEAGVARVHFAALGDDAAHAGVRSLSELRLPPHSPCWAMSVHKSQGSAFDAVLVVLPERSSPLLTREMLYTAITRARRRVVIWGARERLVECVERRVERRSGLRDALWEPGA